MNKKAKVNYRPETVQAMTREEHVFLTFGGNHEKIIDYMRRLNKENEKLKELVQCYKTLFEHVSVFPARKNGKTTMFYNIVKRILELELELRVADE